MGLAFEIFDYRTWSVYAVCTVVLEAWLIGRPLGLSWLKSVLLSLVFNLVTAMCGMTLFTPIHSPFIGTSLNPNPFWNAVFILSCFAVISALIEAVFWFSAKKRPYTAAISTEEFKRNQRLSEVSVLKNSLFAHLVGIPLALVILLLPPKPYVGLEAFTSQHRFFYLSSFLKQAYGSRFTADDKFKPIRSVEDLESGLAPADLAEFREKGGWAAFYAPDFNRFDTTEHKRRPLAVDFNPRATPDGDQTWMMRVYDPRDRLLRVGLLSNGVTTRSRKDLGL